MRRWRGLRIRLIQVKTQCAHGVPRACASVPPSNVNAMQLNRPGLSHRRRCGTVVVQRRQWYICTYSAHAGRMVVGLERLQE